MNNVELVINISPGLILAGQVNMNNQAHEDTESR